MPIPFVFLAILCGYIIGILAMFTTGEEKRSIISFSIAIIFSVWVVIATHIDYKIERETIHTIHESPEGYQYITIDNEPMNITKLFGKRVKENCMIKYIVYDSLAGGIDFLTGEKEYKIIKGETK